MAKIIIVDDSSFLVKMITEFLEAHQHEVIATGKNGFEAVELYQKMMPDLMTLDITMPNKSGYDALKEIFEFDPKAKVMMISALQDKAVIRNCLMLGALGYIEKPLKFKNEDFCQDFLNTINEVFE